MLTGSKRHQLARLADGRAVEAVTLTNAQGLSVTVMTLGATLYSVSLPDRDGNFDEVAPGYESIDDYATQAIYFGATVGRFANRIAGGKFLIDGVVHQVTLNDGPNALHGGQQGFDRTIWDIVDVTQDDVTLRYISVDGDQGFPGTLTVTSRYALNPDNTLTIEYQAATDAATVVSITNHAYWNLSGVMSGQSAQNHMLTIPADNMLPTDSTLIPTGEFRPVAGTPFDFRTPRRIGERLRDGNDRDLVRARGYDHNYVVSRDAPDAEQLMARLSDPVSGRGLELWSNQPGLQFYSGNFLDGTKRGKGGQLYRQGDCVALEPQRFPDTPNQPVFGSARLNPGETYINRIVYRFTVDR